MATSKKGRGGPSQDARTENSTNGDGASTKRRGKNEPGHYQAPEEESDATIDRDEDAAQASANGSTNRDMESAFDDEDMQGDLIDDFDLDEGDGDVDWDDFPPRGGGKSPDK